MAATTISEEQIKITNYLAKLYYDKYFPIQAQALAEPYTAETFKEFAETLSSQIMDSNSTLHLETYDYLQNLTKFELTAVIYMWGMLYYLNGSIKSRALPMDNYFTDENRGYAVHAGYKAGKNMSLVSKIKESLDSKDDQYKKNYSHACNRGEKLAQTLKEDVHFQKLKATGIKKLELIMSELKEAYTKVDKVSDVNFDKILDACMGNDDYDYIAWETDPSIELLKTTSLEEFEFALQLHFLYFESQGFDSCINQYYEKQYKIYFREGYQEGFTDQSEMDMGPSDDGKVDGFNVGYFQVFSELE